MVRPLTLHVLPKPRLVLLQLSPFPNLLDWPLTPLGHQPISQSLSWTLVCSYLGMGMGKPTHANSPPVPLPLWVCTPGKG